MYLERKYISLFSSSVRNFKRRNENLYNFSCPLCGDSTSDKSKARGYIYLKKGVYRFKCHNCGAGMRFEWLLRKVNNFLYKEYRMERFKDLAPEPPPQQSAEQIMSGLTKSVKALESVCVRCSDLPSNSVACNYLSWRKIPAAKYDDIWYCEDLNNLKEIFPKYEETKFHKEPRVVLPIRNRQRELIGVATRAIGPSQLRYINLRLDDEEALIFNLENVDLSKHILITEGGFDSMFLPNAVAVDGGDFAKAGHYIQKDRAIVITDNQPRNPHVVKKIKQMADAGWKVFIWPDNYSAKDINKLVQDGVAVKDIVAMIVKNTFSGLKLKLRIAKWSKI